MEHIDDLVARFESCTLPMTAWTHDAHVSVCWYWSNRLECPAALAHMRAAIRRFNDAVGTENTDDNGYHETLTRYFVGAVGSIAGQPLDSVLTNPRVARTAPLRHWTRAQLFSVSARRAWVAPDVVALPWEYPVGRELGALEYSAVP